HIGVFTTRTKYDSYEGMLIFKSEASEQLSRARRAVKHKLTLSALLSVEPNTIDDQDRRAEYYALCWLLVDWLRGGRQGWADIQFPALVREIGAGHSDSETLETVYGMSVKDMETALIRHIKDFKLVHGWWAPED